MPEMLLRRFYGMSLGSVGLVRVDLFVTCLVFRYLKQRINLYLTFLLGFSVICCFCVASLWDLRLTATG
jgi:hypothetical protein